MKTIHISTGDLNGIGLEVSLKALNELGPKKGVRFVLWRSAGANKEILSLFNQNRQMVRRNEKFSLEDSLNPDKINNILEKSKGKKENILWDIACPPTPTRWVVSAAKICLRNKTEQALVTGPLSKSQIQKEGFSERGHTDLLKKLSNTKYVFMTFWGEFFNVALLTGHVPLKKVSYNRESLNKCIQLCLNIHPCPFFAGTGLTGGEKDKTRGEEGGGNKKLAVLGLNPHAGEEGLLGTEEHLIKQDLEKWKNKVEGPLVPDVAFLKKNRQKFFIYICLYHDQGLIPFKMIHERKSFQSSLGLPFIRTSVSHGTAKDIFGKNKAEAESMKQALLWTTHSLSLNKPE